MEVSIIIPCYNYAHYLGEAIESALAQTKKCEVIVVDDGSSDNTKEVAARYPVKYIFQTNKGLSGARNTGIKEASSAYVICLDADDKLAPTCVERCLTLQFGNQIVCPGQQEFDESSHYYDFNPPFGLREFLVENRIHCASLFPKAAWAKVGGYDEQMKDGYEDWEFWIRLLKFGCEVNAIDEPLFMYRIHKGSMLSGTRKKDALIRSYMKSKHSDLYNKPKPNIRLIGGICEFCGIPGDDCSHFRHLKSLT